MIDPDEHEIAAIQAASPMAGEYLESIGKTDLAVLTDTEWLTLLEVIVTAYQDALAQRLIAAAIRHRLCQGGPHEGFHGAVRRAARG